MSTRTGLVASPVKRYKKPIKKPSIHLKAQTGPAPFIIKPFAGLYNPYASGCSLLCNHPADLEARKMIQKAKDSWTNDGKSYLYPDEVAAIKAELEHIHIHDTQRLHPESFVPIESVPEELFRKYTDTDSRPLTPAPTMISVHTRASATRRCVTPDPMHTSEVREKTLLVLDLRRSHSQETLSWYGSNYQTLDPPLIRISQMGTKPLLSPGSSRSCSKKRNSIVNVKRPKSAVEKSQQPEPKNHLEVPKADVSDEEDAEDRESDDGVMKRRGRRRRKRGRNSSRGPSIFHVPVDPETLVATLDPDSQNASARPSLIPNNSNILNDLSRIKMENNRRLSSLDIDSFLDYNILRQLRRELTSEIIENEFNFERRMALEEALKTVPKNRIDCQELLELQKELNLPVVDTDLWLSLPRMFTRSSIRFELPMDSRTLNTLTPIEYVTDNIVLKSTRKMLYNFVFNIFKVEYEEEEIERERKIEGKRLSEALGAMMGQKLKEEHIDYFQRLVGWLDENLYDFKTFCGICALCERLMARKLYSQLPDRKLDPCHEIERVDFESLENLLYNKTPDKRLVDILQLIKTV